MKLIRLEIKSLWNHIKYLNEISFFDFRFIDKHFIIIVFVETISVLVVHYSLSFTTYKAASGGFSFDVLVVHYSLNFTAYKATNGGVFLRCGTLSLGYNCTSCPCAKMVSTVLIESFTKPCFKLFYGWHLYIQS